MCRVRWKSAIGKIPGGTLVCKDISRGKRTWRERITGFKDITLETTEN